jgi:hypothetical protein
LLWLIFGVGSFCSLYVRVAVLNSAQDGNWMGLLFGFATFFSVCFGVQLSFSCTPSTCFHVETGRDVHVQIHRDCKKTHKNTAQKRIADAKKQQRHNKKG